MLSDLPDIYMIITPEPSDAFILQRGEVITSLAVDDAIRENFPAWIELVCVGLSNTLEGAVSPGVSVIIKAIKDKQPSFPSDPMAKLLDLRVSAAAVLLQYLTEPPPENGAYSRVVSALLLAASRLRAPWSDCRYSVLVERLRSAAQLILDEDAIKQRERKNLDHFNVNIKGADHNQVAAATNAAFKALGEGVAANIRADREELQILWWVFGRYSTKLKVPYSELSAGDAAVASAVELADLMLVPPVPAARDFLRTVLENKLSVPLSQLIAQTSLSALEFVGHCEPHAQSVLHQHPGLLPLTWLAARLVESEKSLWEAEFEKKVQLSPASVRPISEWAEQIFAERVACALISSDWEKPESN